MVIKYFKNIYAYSIENFKVKGFYKSQIHDIIDEVVIYEDKGEVYSEELGEKYNKTERVVSYTIKEGYTEITEVEHRQLLENQEQGFSLIVDLDGKYILGEKQPNSYSTWNGSSWIENSEKKADYISMNSSRLKKEIVKQKTLISSYIEEGWSALEEENKLNELRSEVQTLENL